MFRWFAYSVIISLANLWVAGAVTWYTHRPVFQQQFIDGSVLVFCFVTVMSSFGDAHWKIAQKFGRAISDALMLVMFILFCGSLVLYTLTLLGEKPAEAMSASWGSGGALIAAILFGAACRELEKRAG